MADIHDKIKELREGNHYRQWQVADFLGISQQAYSYYELDKRELPSRHIVSLAQLYEVSTDYLLGMEQVPAAPYDMDSKFIQGVSLKDALIELGKLGKDGRREIIRYLAYLEGTQE